MGYGTLRVREVEQSIYSERAKKLHEFQTLTGGNPAKANPNLIALQVEAEIEKLLKGANTVLVSYANG